MKRYIWLAAVMVCSVNLCGAQEPAKKPAEVMKATETINEGKAAPELVPEGGEPWHITGGLIYKNFQYEHDALQQRAPTLEHQINDWTQGDTSGSGWGLQSSIGRGDGRLDVSFIKSTFEFTHTVPPSSQKIDTTTREFEISWSEVRGRESQMDWGTIIGFRYVGAQKRDIINEMGNRLDASGNINYMMLMGGYNANWRPFGSGTVQAHGTILFLLGEAKGPAAAAATPTG